MAPKKTHRGRKNALRVNKSAQLQKHLPLLKYLHSGKKKIANAIVAESDRDLINVFCECAHNCLKGNLPLNASQYRSMHSHRQHLRVLSDRKAPIKKKKKALQKGGFLPALLGVALPVILKILGI